MAGNPRDREDARQREAREALARVEREAGTWMSSALARLAAHFAARDARRRGHGETDRIELWGRRIGRALSLVGAVLLAIYLVLTYWH